MHRDTKIGLSLGILLVGIVAALFFRNETEAEAPKPDQTKLDNPYGERPLIEPDFRDAEPFPAPERKLPNFANDNRKPRRIEGPIATTPKTTQPATFERKPTPPPATTGRTYTVQPGETLSGIALKLLGRSSRYRDIYAINRDVMRDPDDIRGGMTLRIPQRTSASKLVPEPTPEPQPAAPTTPRSYAGFDSDLPTFPRSSRPQPKPRTRTYLVRPGDNLERIAHHFYGDYRAASRILDANRDLILSRDDLRAGMNLVIP